MEFVDCSKSSISGSCLFFFHYYIYSVHIDTKGRQAQASLSQHKVPRCISVISSTALLWFSFFGRRSWSYCCQSFSKQGSAMKTFAYLLLLVLLAFIVLEEANAEASNDQQPQSDQPRKKG